MKHTGSTIGLNPLDVSADAKGGTRAILRASGVAKTLL